MRLEQIAREIGAELNGDPDCEVLRVATLENAGAGCLAFLSGERHRKYLKNTRASAVILRKENLAECPVPALICNDPYLAYARVATLLTGQIAEAHSGVHSSALIHASAKVAGSASIGAYCVIDADTEIDEFVMLDAHCVVGKSSRIGARSHLSARVTIGDRVRIGSRTRIHSGVVIGADGFGFANDNGVWVKIPQAGGVVIGDDVEIGANTTIDRGALENTIIGDGVKIDNLVQIAHNVVIGEHTAIAGCVGIAGSTKIGRHCAIGGASGIGGHLNITDGVVIAGMTRLNKSILKPGQYVSGTPVDTVDKWRKNSARFRQLDDLARRLQALEKR